MIIINSLVFCEVSFSDFWFYFYSIDTNTYYLVYN